MSWKFTLLGLEKTNDYDNIKEENKTMAKKKLTKQQRKFKKAVRKCHKTPTKNKFYKCMKKELKK